MWSRITIIRNSIKLTKPTQPTQRISYNMSECNHVPRQSLLNVKWGDRVSIMGCLAGGEWTMATSAQVELLSTLRPSTNALHNAYIGQFEFLRVVCAWTHLKDIYDKTKLFPSADNLEENRERLILVSLKLCTFSIFSKMPQYLTPFHILSYCQLCWKCINMPMCSWYKAIL